MRIRQHRGGLAESLATVETIEPTRAAVAVWAARALARPVVAADIDVTPYGYDARIEWDTHLVTLKNYGVLGMCDGAAK